MKTRIKTIEVDRIGVAEVASFTIKASAKAFKILSDGLYSDKILAIVRELSCNAYDAHIDEGTMDKPFLVHLPNTLEPWYSIRDYGVGLSHENVMHLYTTYFDSTKTESNDYIGALGLGSKSPFSYVETFTVTSYFNGEMRTYIADLGEAGVPQISLLEGFPMATKEPNGLEIKLAVQRGDFQVFEYKAKEIYKRFDPVPTVIGVPNFEVEKVQYALKGNGWRVINDKNGGYYSRRPSAIQGTVAYPIDRNAMRDISDAQSRLLDGLHIELDFEIGELDIAANRESLGYDKRTSANIMKKIDVALEEIGIELNKSFKACKTLWEAKKLYRKTFGTDYQDPLRRLVDGNKIKIMWKDHEIENAKVYGQTSEWLNISGFNVISESRRNCSRVRQRRYAHNLTNNHIEVTASDKVVFFVDDLEKGGAVARIKYFVDEHDEKSVEVYMIRNKTKKVLANLRKELGYPKFRWLSELPKPPKRERDTNGEVRGNGYVWLGKKNKPSHEWDNTLVDFKGGGLYIPVHRCKPLNKDGGEISRFSTVIMAAQSIKMINLTTTSIYGIPKGQVSKLKGKWVNVLDFIETKTAAMASDPATVSQVGRSVMLHNFDDQVRRAQYIGVNLNEVSKTVKDKNGLIAQLAGYLTAAVDSGVDNELILLTKYFSIEIKDVSKIDLIAMWKRIKVKYPMIEWPFDNWGTLSSDTIEKVANYINLIDGK